MQGEQILGNVVSMILSPLYQLVAVCMFLYFLFGVVMFINGMNEPEQMKKGKAHLRYGLLGLFIIFSVGGILKFFNDVFGGIFTY